MTGVWGSDGTILFSKQGGGLRRVSAAGGACTDVANRGLVPALMPDGHHFVVYLDKEGNNPAGDTGGPDEGDSPAETALNKAEKAIGGRDSQFFEEGSELARVRGAKRTPLIVDPPGWQAAAPNRNGPEAAGNVVRERQSWLGREGPSAFRTLPSRRGVANPALHDRRHIPDRSNAGGHPDPNDFDTRIVRMNSPHPPPGIRTWTGDSVGHWERDTLVIDTANFNDELNGGGTGRDLHTVERITPATGGTLLYRATVEDAAAFTKPWTVEFPWVASTKPIFENSCHEGNYSLKAILDGTRREQTP